MSVDRVFSGVNPAISSILRSPLHWLLSYGLMLLTVTGRRSGRTYTIPVGYQLEDDLVTVLASEAQKKNWWRNFHEPGRVQLWVRGKELEGTAELVSPQSDEFRFQSERTLRRVPFIGNVFGIDYVRKEGLTDAQLEELGKNIAIVQIRLD